MDCIFCGDKETCPDCSPEKWAEPMPPGSPCDGVHTPVYYYPKETLKFLFKTDEEYEKAPELILCWDT